MMCVKAAGIGSCPSMFCCEPMLFYLVYYSGCMITQLTWCKPDKKTSRGHLKNVLLGCARVILSSSVVFVAACAATLINITRIQVLMTTICFGYYYYRIGLSFGMTMPEDEEVLFKPSLWRFLFFVINFIPLTRFHIIRSPATIGVRISLLLVMSVLTYWKEYLIIFLIFVGKYDYKQGHVLSVRRIGKKAPGYRRYSFYIVYNMSFEDDVGRSIPVLVDYPTYTKYRNGHDNDAFLLRFKCGKQYLFYVLKW